MPKLITFSCFMLFWVFYEMSGGTDFQPRERVVVSQAPFANPSAVHATYVRPVAAPQVVNASYVPVETQPLEVAAKTPSIENQLAPVPQETVASVETAIEFRFVAGNRVNLREGPGTNHAVLETLTRGTAAELVASNDDGWAQIRLTETGQTGWMAERLLSDG